MSLFRGKELHFDYKSVLFFLKFIEEQKYEKAFDVIGLESEDIIIGGEDYIVDLYKYLNGQRFVLEGEHAYLEGLKIQRDRGNITNEVYEEEKKLFLESQEKEFCHFGDFDLVSSLFLKYYNIDLFNDNINWFNYLFKLNLIFEEETNALIERIKKRTFKPLTGKGVSKQNLQGKRLKQKYKL